MLAVISDEDTYLAVTEELRKHRPLSTAFWIGLSDLDSDGEFVWEDGTVLKNRCFSVWEDGQPSTEDCVLLKRNFQWKTQKCSRKRGYICQLPVADCPTDCTSCITI
ncbi:CD209 antigen-like protein E [Ptychodera flava]|uniref:CD209 antigen-like protein E n=1 Tax=Ptychodera flava TaxID=63121 RepID=UPI003969BF25